MALAETLKDYFGYADEREERETGLIYRRAFMALGAANLLIAYFLVTLSQLASVHHIESNVFLALNIVALALFVFYIAISSFATNSATNKGIIAGRVFSYADTFPWTRALALSAALSGIFCAILYVLRCAAETALVGFGQVFWLSNIAVALFFFPLLFACLVAALYFNFRDAKKAQDKIIDALED